MIGYIKGMVISKSGQSLIVNTAGVGYKVNAPSAMVLKLKIGAEAEFYIHTYVREDQLSLYGFLKQDDLELFEMLISVSGVGPKVALSVMSAVASEHIRSAIASVDAAAFIKVSGVGRKTAERLIVELREKIGELGGSISIKGSKDFSESLDALVALGYSGQEAREALKRVPPGLSDSNQMIKAALKIMGGR